MKPKYKPGDLVRIIRPSGSSELASITGSNPAIIGSGTCNVFGVSGIRWHLLFCDGKVGYIHTLPSGDTTPTSVIRMQKAEQ